jgi:hypothetical protein
MYFDRADDFPGKQNPLSIAGSLAKERGLYAISD